MKTKHLSPTSRFINYAISLSFLGLLVFPKQILAQNVADLITRITCPGADTVLAAMVISDNGIIHYTTNRETGVYNITTGKKLSTSAAQAKLFKDNNNNIWRLQANAITKMNEKGNVLDQLFIPTNYSSSSIKLNDLAVDQKGNIWIATNNGLLIKTSSGWKEYNTTNSALWSNNVYSVTIGPDNKKWIITDSGMDILGDTICSNCNQWETLFNTKKGQWFPSAHAIVFDKNDMAITCTPNGRVLRIKNGTVDTLPVSRKNALQNFLFSCLAIDSSGYIWAGTWGNGIIKVNPHGNNYKIYNSANSNLGSNYINALYSGRNGLIYAGTASKGIYKIKPLKESSGSAAESVEVQNPGIRTQSLNHINVFPNPSSGIFNVTSDQQEVFDLKVSDMSGKLVKTMHGLNTGSSSILDLSDLSAGIYILNFYSKTLTSSIKVTIQK